MVSITTGFTHPTLYLLLQYSNTEWLLVVLHSMNPNFGLPVYRNWQITEMQMSLCLVPYKPEAITDFIKIHL